MYKFFTTGNFTMCFSEGGVMLDYSMSRLNYIWQKFVQINNTKFYNGCVVDSEMKYSGGASTWLSYAMLILWLYAH